MTNPSDLKRRIIGLAILSGAVLVAVVAILGLYIKIVTMRIDERILQLHEARGSQLYAFYPALRVNQVFPLPELRSLLEDQGYQESRDPEDALPGEYLLSRKDNTAELKLNRLEFKGTGHPQEPALARLHFEKNGNDYTLTEIFRTDTREKVESFESRPKKIAAFVAGRLRTQSSIPFSDMPVTMRLAVMAIEDVHFLEHSGVSLRSTLRALWTDIRTGKYAEGGSTITQQLMKNLFFSHEKALARKIKEAIFAFVTESRHSKEAILEAYLNEVYLGQLSTHEIHGVSEGARYYFNRPLSELSLSQSALLAAIIQAPGVHDPRKYPDRALKRRNIVLKKMQAAEFILDDECEEALKAPLGVIPAERSLDDADYFLDLVMDRLPPDVKSRLENEPLSIYTTLNPYLQSAASRLLKANIERLKKLSPAIEKNEKRGFHLQGALIALSVKDGGVLALQGGKSYRQTQFNRVLQGRRQPGSLFKPFVYLSGFAGKPWGKTLTPLTPIEDTPFEWKYEGQSWKPKNYDNTFREKVTAREALENSMNVPTARLAEQVGVNPIRENLMKAGVKSPLMAVPSICLGSAEVTPIELAEAYSTIANLGVSTTLRPSLQIFDSNGNIAFVGTGIAQEVLPAGPTFMTVQLMKGVFQRGTARSAQASGLPLANFAGKTGTTNDAKDAWFIGFSPSVLVLVWVGYDEEETVGLTGGVAALPLWVEFMKRAQPFLSSEDFAQPNDVAEVEIDPDRMCLPYIPQSNAIKEYFIKGSEPTMRCP